MTETEAKPRRMPRLQKVHEHWLTLHPLEAEAWFGQIDLDEMSCYACGWWSEPIHLERAHLVDRVFGGEDRVSNLVPLCRRCHREMPSFRAGEERQALDWVRFHRNCVDALMPQICDWMAHIERVGHVPPWMTRGCPNTAFGLRLAAADYLADVTS